MNPFSSKNPPLFDFQLRSSATGIPFSLLLFQLRRKRMNSPCPRPSTPDLGSVNNTVWSLASIMEEIQQSILSKDDESSEDALNSISRETGDSIVWLFRKVFSSSPNLTMDLFFVAKFLVAPKQMKKRKTLALVAEGVKLDDVNSSILQRSRSTGDKNMILSPGRHPIPASFSLLLPSFGFSAPPHLDLRSPPPRTPPLL